jgi:hypothetical protein
MEQARHSTVKSPEGTTERITMNEFGSKSGYGGEAAEI